jgi:hypothetical protein
MQVGGVAVGHDAPTIGTAARSETRAEQQDWEAKGCTNIAFLGRNRARSSGSLRVLEFFPGNRAQLARVPAISPSSGTVIRVSRMVIPPYLGRYASEGVRPIIVDTCVSRLHQVVHAMCRFEKNWSNLTSQIPSGAGAMPRHDQ